MLRRKGLTLAATIAIAVAAAIVLVQVLLRGWVSDDVSRPHEQPASAPTQSEAAPERVVASRAADLTIRPRPSSDPDDPSSSAASSRGAPDRDHDLHGVVVDRDDEPVPGAAIAVMHNEARAVSSVIDLDYYYAEVRIAEVKTDFDGRFRIRVAQGRPYDLVVTAPGRPRTTTRNRYAGEFVRIVLQQAAMLKGTVTRAADHAPLAEVRVKALSRTDHAPIGVGVTDEAGRYELAGLQPGLVVIEVEPPTAKAAGWTEVRLNPGATVVRDFELEAGTTVSGIVRDAVTREPIQGAEVGEGWTFSRSVRTGPDGRYLIRGVAAENGEMHVRAKGYGRQEHELGRPLPAELDMDFELQPGRSVRGRVVDGSAAPVGGAYVAAIASTRLAGVQKIDWPSTRSGPDGRFEVRDLRRDVRHALFVRKEGYGSATFDFPPAETSGDAFDVGDVRIDAAGGISGVAVDAKGRPVPDLTLDLQGGNADRFRLWSDAAASRAAEGYADEQSGRSDDLGRFQFTDLTAGVYSLRPRGRWKSPALSVVVRGGEVTSGVRLVIPIEVSIKGRVIRTDGKPVPMCVVEAYSEALPKEGRSRASVCLTSGDGEFELRQLEEGNYTVVALPIQDEGGARHRLGSATVTAVHTGASDVRVVLSAAAKTGGTVIGAKGTPLKAVLVLALEAGTEIQLSSATTAEDGSFALDVPQDASVRLRAMTPVYADGRIQHWGEPTAEVAWVKAGTQGLTIVLTDR